MHHDIREDERHGDYGRARADRHELHRREGGFYGGHGYYHGGRYYSHRRYYYRGGRRYYSYYGLVPGGVSVNIGFVIPGVAEGRVRSQGVCAGREGSSEPIPES